MAARDKDQFRTGTHNGCPSGKLAFHRRKDAHTQAQRMRKEGNKGIHAYACTRGCDQWHVGHMPPATRVGEMSAAEWYASPKCWRAS